MKLTRPALRRSQRGSATVELATVLLPLLLLITATADAGRALYTYNTLLKAARGAARFLALANPPDATAQATALNLVLYGDVDVPATNQALAPGLTTSMVQICTPALCSSNHNAVAILGSGTTMGLVSVRISGYSYTSLFSAVLPATIAFNPIQVTMRGLP